MTLGVMSYELLVIASHDNGFGYECYGISYNHYCTKEYNIPKT